MYGLGRTIRPWKFVNAHVTEICAGVHCYVFLGLVAALAHVKDREGADAMTVWQSSSSRNGELNI
jgi:hypothetical protein